MKEWIWKCQFMGVYGKFVCLIVVSIFVCVCFFMEVVVFDQILLMGYVDNEVVVDVIFEGGFILMMVGD